MPQLTLVSGESVMHSVVAKLSVNHKKPERSDLDIRYLGPRGHLIGSYGAWFQGLSVEVVPDLFREACCAYLFGENAQEAVRDLRNKRSLLLSYLAESRGPWGP